MYLPARAVLLVQLQRQALGTRCRARAEREQALAGERALRQPHGRRRPQVEPFAAYLDGRQAVRSGDVDDRGLFTRRRARPPTGGGGEGDRRVGRRIRQLRVGDPASISRGGRACRDRIFWIDGLVEGIAAAGEERAAGAQVADKRVRRVGRPGRAGGNDEQVDGFARKATLPHEVVAHHAEDVPERRERVEEHAGVAHAAESVRAGGKAEVEHADARRAWREGVEPLRRAPRGGGAQVLGRALRLGEVGGGRRVSCRRRSQLHLRLGEPSRTRTAEAEYEIRLGGPLRQSRDGLHDASPVLRADKLAVRIVCRKAPAASEAVQRDIGHGSGGKAFRLRPDADRVRRVRPKVAHGMRDEVPDALLGRRGRNAHSRRVSVTHGGIDLQAHCRRAIARPPGRQPPKRRVGLEQRARQQILRPHGRRHHSHRHTHRTAYKYIPDSVHASLLTKRLKYIKSPSAIEA